MEFYEFDMSNGKKISQFNSDFMMSRILHTNEGAHIGFVFLEKNGLIGFHQAVVPQLLMIIKGEGLVRGVEEKYFQVQAGDAVFWNEGEWHETKSTSELTAIVIESEDLDPLLFMASKVERLGGN